jgi:diguanylate cyclase (GGDEF)-like protein
VSALAIEVAEPQPAVVAVPRAHAVLVVEDDPVYRHAVQHLLAGKGYEVESLTDGCQGVAKACAPDAPRILILDWMLPGLDGPEICRQVRQRGPEYYQYILLLTSRNQTADIVEGLEAGADDYLLKPPDAHELVARIQVGERILRLHDSLVQAQESLRFQATHDVLTGLWNRRALMDLLKAEFERAARRAAPISVFMADIDCFKRINDEHGHLVGDVVLQQVAHRLSQAVRPYDLIGRYGGEEFVIAASELGAGGACEMAERLREEVSATAINCEGKSVPATISVGVATATPRPQCWIEKLVQRADAAMYLAKRNGRNRVEASVL